MIKKLSAEEIREVCGDLLSPDISNLQILQPLNDKQIKQVNDFACDWIERLNQKFEDLGRLGKYENIFILKDIESYEYVKTIINEYRDLLKINQGLEVHKLETELSELRKQEIDRKRAEHKKRFKRIEAPTKATFCLLIKNSGHYKQIGMSELMINGAIKNREKYLKAICEYYKLEYQVRMRSAVWSENDRPQYHDEIRELIYPKIDQQTIDAIENYINSKKLHQ
jgi:hypothetical protein